MSDITAAAITQTFQDLEDVFRQGVRDGTILKVMEERRAEIVSTMSQIARTMTDPRKRRVIENASSADAKVKAALAKHQFVMRVIIDWKKNRKSPDFLAQQQAALAKYDTAKVSFVLGEYYKY